MTELNSEQVDREVLPFLSLSARPDVKAIAMQYFLGLTGSEDGRHFIARNDKYLSAIVDLTGDEQVAIVKDAYLALINLSTVPDISWTLASLKSHPDFVIDLIRYVLKAESVLADPACMILSNLTRTEQGAQKCLNLIADKSDQIGLDKIIQIFCREKYNAHASLHYLGPFISNLTQVKEARKYILDKERCVIQRLLPYTQYMDSLVRRGGIVGTLRNCCFERDYHEWLLSEKVDILPRLLLPLAGGEEFDEDDMEKLPEDLQYLEPGKEREADADIRKMLVESVHQLCVTKIGRNLVKNKNAYVIFRELHQWEKDPAAKAAIEKVVQLLIADEPEVGMEDLDNVEIPKDIEAKLQQAYDAEQAEIAEELKQMEIKLTETSKSGS